MAEHTKGARNSTWDKHTDRDKGRKQEKIQGNKEWVDQGRRTNSEAKQGTKDDRVNAKSLCEAVLIG